MHLAGDILPYICSSPAATDPETVNAPVSVQSQPYEYNAVKPCQRFALTRVLSDGFPRFDIGPEFIATCCGYPLVTTLGQYPVWCKHWLDHVKAYGTYSAAIVFYWFRPSIRVFQESLDSYMQAMMLSGGLLGCYAHTLNRQPSLRSSEASNLRLPRNSTVGTIRPILEGYYGVTYRELVCAKGN